MKQRCAEPMDADNWPREAKGRTMKQLCAWVLWSAMLTVSALSQSALPRWYLGGYGGFQNNFHRPDFPIPAPTDPGLSAAAGRFANGSNALGFHGGLLGEYAFSQQLHGLLRVGYHSAGGTLQAEGQRSGTADSIVSLSLESSLGYGEIAPAILFYDLGGIPSFWGLGGFAVSFPVHHSYSLSEHQGDTTRIYATDQALPTGVRLALRLGLGYDFAINTHWHLAPYMELAFPLTQVSGDTQWQSWRIPQLRFGIHLKFAFTTTAPPPLAPLKLQMRVGYYDQLGKYAPLEKIRVEEIAYAELYPILPYVFFAQNSAEIPEAYMQYRKAGASAHNGHDSVAQDAIIQNYRVLQLIGKRMQEFPKASLRIVGTTDGQEPLAIAQQRAEAVKLYLVSTFGIPPERILVEAQRLPAKPSALNDPDGQAENRRVEFYPSIPEILEPVFVEKDRRRLAFPDYIEFRPIVSGLDSTTLITYQMQIEQAGKKFRNIERHGLPTIIRPIRWRIMPDELAAASIPIEYHYTLQDAHNRTAAIHELIPVEYISKQAKIENRLPDRRIQKFSLVLFDFDKAELTPANQRILDRYVLPAIQFNSVVKIYGYTDRIGDAAYNKRLAQRRAETVKRYLQSKAKARQFEAIGVGEDLLLYNNDLPIGRQLSRTVQIIVETPIAK